MPATNPERLVSDVVVLRPSRLDDAGPYAAAFREDPELGVLYGADVDPDEATAVEYIAAREASAQLGLSAGFTIADPQTDAFWGSLVLHHFDWRHRRCEVGFWLAKPVRGRGVGVAAVRLAVSWAFETFDLQRVEMTTTPDNPGVPGLAGRLGFTEEGVLRLRNIERGQRVSIVWFGVLREEWDARREPQA